MLGVWFGEMDIWVGVIAAGWVERKKETEKMFGLPVEDRGGWTSPWSESSVGGPFSTLSPSEI